MSQRAVAQSGLFAALLVLILSFGTLGWRTFGAIRSVVEVGKSAPDFTLPDTQGRPVSLADFRGQTVVLYFGSDQCRVCDGYEQKLSDLAGMYAGDARVKFLAINSNTAARAASVDQLRLLDSDRVPTLLDPLAEVARRFGASVTPTFCVIDANGTLRYSGAFDNGSADADPVGRFCARAVRQTVEGMPVEVTATQAFGRSIAWVK